MAEDTTKPAAPGYFDVAFESYQKAAPLDTKKDYTDKITIELARLRIDYFNAGVKIANKNDYVSAHADFLKSLAVSNFLRANYGQKDLDTLSMFQVAYSDQMNKNMDSAKMLFQQLSGFTYNGTSRYATMPHNVFISLVNAELALKDTASAIASLKKAEQALPKDEAFIITSVNIALGQKKFDEAITGLLNAIQFEPSNAGFYYNLAICYKEKGDLANAETAYKKAIELKPDYVDAEYSLGALYFNEGVAIDKQRQNLALGDKKYDALGKQSDSLYEKSIPEFEKAHKTDPKDMATLRALNAVYTRTKQDAKAADIQKEIDALGK